jgi:hypothetical protein
MEATVAHEDQPGPVGCLLGSGYQTAKSESRVGDQAGRPNGQGTSAHVALLLRTRQQPAEFARRLSR